MHEFDTEQYCFEEYSTQSRDSGMQHIKGLKLTNKFIYKGEEIHQSEYNSQVN